MLPFRYPSPASSKPKLLFLQLPVDLRLDIYRHILISPLNLSQRGNDSRKSLWRPIAADENVFKIGYFPRDAVVPLLLVNRQVHDEAAGVLYGENGFMWHVSGFPAGHDHDQDEDDGGGEDGESDRFHRPSGFFGMLPSKYRDLLRRFYVRTGYRLEGLVDHRPHTSVGESGDQPRFVSDYMKQRDVRASASILRHALGAQCLSMIGVNENEVIRCVEVGCKWKLGDIDELWGHDRVSEWRFEAWHLWKLVLLEREVDEEGEAGGDKEGKKKGEGEREGKERRKQHERRFEFHRLVYNDDDDVKECQVVKPLISVPLSSSSLYSSLPPL